MDRVKRLGSQSAVVIFGKSTCCMCHTVKRLFSGLGVRTVVHELDEMPKGREMEKVLAGLLSRDKPLPVVFIGGKMVGSTNEIMSLHLGGELVPLLRDAGAIWV